MNTFQPARPMMPLHKLSACLIALASALLPHPAGAQEMDKLWGESVVKLRPEDASRGQLFADGNYAMFIHWGLYSLLGNKVDGKTYYGGWPAYRSPNTRSWPNVSIHPVSTRRPLSKLPRTRE